MPKMLAISFRLSQCRTFDMEFDFRLIPCASAFGFGSNVAVWTWNSISAPSLTSTLGFYCEMSHLSHSQLFKCRTLDTKFDFRLIPCTSAFGFPLSAFKTFPTTPTLPNFNLHGTSVLQPHPVSCAKVAVFVTAMCQRFERRFASIFGSISRRYQPHPRHPRATLY